MNVRSADTFAVDLTACDREPIHIVGSIQPHGFLLTVDAASLVIVQASANAPAGTDVGAALETALPELVPIVRRYLDDQPTEDGAHTCGPSPSPPPHSRPTRSRRIASAASNVVELEEEFADPSVEAGLDALSLRLRAFVQRLRQARNVEDLCAIVAEDDRHVTGFDRALVYRFDRDWHVRCWRSRQR